MKARIEPPGTSGLGKAHEITLRECADLFFASYTGRDASIVSRIDFWLRELGRDRPLIDISDDDVFNALECLKALPKLHYRGGAQSGRPALVPHGAQRRGSTVNRYKASLASLYKFARVKRLLPRGHVSPLTGISRERESSGKLRYLSQDEYRHLLIAAKGAAGPSCPC